MLLAEPPAQPCRGVTIEPAVCFGDGTQTEVVGPSSQLPVQTFHHVGGFHPFHRTSGLSMDGFDHAPNTLPRRARTEVRATGFGRIAPTEGVAQEIERLAR